MSNHRSKRARGQGMTEYGTVIAIIVMVVIVSLSLVSGAVGGLFSTINSSVGNISGPTPSPAPVVLTYRGSVLATSPIAYWRLGEASGLVAHDEMGANNGTYGGEYFTLGVTGLLAGDANTAIATDGTATHDYGYMAVSTAPDPGVGSFTVLEWVSPDAGQSTHDYGLFTNGNAYFGSGWYVFLGSDGHIHVGVKDTTPPFAYARSLLDGTTTIGTGKHQIALVFDRTAQLLRLYIDGVPDASTLNISALGYIGDGTGLNFGYISWGGPQAPFGGTWDEPAVWTRALSAAEIATLYARG